MIHFRGTIRPNPLAQATAGAARGKKHLFNWRNQAILTSDGRLLGECRFKAFGETFIANIAGNLVHQIPGYVINDGRNQNESESNRAFAESR